MVEAVIIASDIDGQRKGLAEVIDGAWEFLEHGGAVTVRWPDKGARK